MGIHSWKKTIAIGVLVAFVGMGVAWAAEQGVPQFQEKAETPVIKKHKFPLLPVLIGTVVAQVSSFEIFIYKINKYFTE